MLKELAELAKDTIKAQHLYLNYFAENHGKCATRTSPCSRYYRDYTKCQVDGKPVYTTPQFLAILLKAVEKTNATKLRLSAKLRATTTPHCLLQVTFFGYHCAEATNVVQLVAQQFISSYHFRLYRGCTSLLAKIHQRDAEDPRVYPMTQKNQGPARAAKLGWSQSKNNSALFNVN